MIYPMKEKCGDVSYFPSRSCRPKKTFLSKNLIALLSYGGVPEEFFMGIVNNALEDAHGILSNKKAALRGSFLDKKCLF